MRKLILLVAVATTISFAACTNAKTTDQTDEANIESAELALDEASVKLDSTTQVLEEVVDSLTNTVD